MTANTEIHSLLQALVKVGAEGSPGPIMIAEAERLLASAPLACVGTLFDAIQHGDEIHKAWLKEAIENHFAGKPVPPPRAKTPALDTAARVGDDADLIEVDALAWLDRAYR